MLGAVGEYEEWVRRELPAEDARLAVAEFLIATAERPWQAPSSPIEQLCERPVFEVREAVLNAADGLIAIWYRHTYATGLVDVLGVMGPNRATEDLT
jgi:hypothetical protein